MSVRSLTGGERSQLSAQEVVVGSTRRIQSCIHLCSLAAARPSSMSRLGSVIIGRLFAPFSHRGPSMSRCLWEEVQSKDWKLRKRGTFQS